MHATIIGSGRIGRGFVASLLQRNKVDFNFFDVDENLIKRLNDMNDYTVHVLGNSSKKTVIDHFYGFNLNDSEAWEKELEKTDIIFTAVGGKNISILGKIIGEHYKTLLEKGEASSFIIITCENWLKPAEDLKNSILSVLSLDQQNVFEKNIDISQAVIRASGTSAPEGQETLNPLDTWMQDYWEVPVDSQRIKNNKIPNWEFFEFDEEFGEMLPQKIYTNNTSVALIGYLGYLKGYKYIADAANDPEIEIILAKCYEEINKALIFNLGVSEEKQLEFARIAEKKYKDHKIIDNIERIARDPLRKLSPDDRFIGPAKMALKAGITPTAIALGTAAALFFDYPEDDAAKKLQELRSNKGINYILDTICELENEPDLKRIILSSVNELKTKGWIKEEDVNA